ncbi:MAG: ATP-binding cassette domain-containing protein [Candidatus Microgenomates bacterium]|jgi:ABC-2 type transport system ATP-binding protein
MDRAIIVEHLVKDFEIKSQKKQVHALKSISFSVQPGELVGFIGPNGAGKTTAVKTLSGLLYPTSGFVQVLGFNPWERKSEFLKQISLVMGQKNQLWWDLTARETFELNKAIYEISTREYQESLNELTTLLDARKLVNIPVRKLSLGQRMRLELIAALLHKPRILFLDEPTIGLDLIGRAKMRDFIYDYNRKSEATILLTSHNMDDLANLARRVIVINDGWIIFDGMFEEFLGIYAKEKLIKVNLSQETDLGELRKIGKINKIAYPEVLISVPRSTTAVAAAEILQNYPVDGLTIEEIPIEEAVRHLLAYAKIN